MNLVKFLLLDASLLISAFAFLLIFRAVKAKPLILEDSPTSKILNQSSTVLPQKQELLELEEIARKDGSGITHDSLIGRWIFTSVWKQASDEEDLISSTLLRLFAASLDIQKTESDRFTIVNSIEFGLLSILFTGVGYLKGKQPLLPFFFENIEFKVSSRVLFNRYLKKPIEKDSPFFALIAIDKNEKWLSARGRGGGLALWVKG